MAKTKINKAFVACALILTIFSGCFAEDNCTSLRDEVINISNEDPYPENRLIKIYDPREISRTDKEIKCEGIGSWGDTTESKILYRVYQDREGDWMIEYYPLGNK